MSTYQDEGYNFLLGIDQILDNADGINPRNIDSVMESGVIDYEKTDFTDVGLETGDDGKVNLTGSIDGVPAADIAEVITPTGEINAGANGYYNFGTPLGELGYGFRDNLGQVEYKDYGGSWGPFGSGGSSLVVINPNAGTTINLALTDASTLMILTATTAISVIVPTNALVPFPIGTQIDVLRADIGEVTFSGSVSFGSKDGNMRINGRWVAVSLIKTGTDSWILLGDLKI